MIPSLPAHRKIINIDMDAFYAAMEQRGRPRHYERGRLIGPPPP